MSQLRLQFVLGAGYSSRLISWWGNGYGGYSHVDAILANDACLGARSDAVGNEPAGVRVRPAGYEKWVRRRVASLEVTTPEYTAWETFLIEQLGMPYDKSNIVGLITGHPLMETGHWICSALQTAALQLSVFKPRWIASGLATETLQGTGLLPSPLSVPPQQITPNSLLLMLDAIGFTISKEIVA